MQLLKLTIDFIKEVAEILSKNNLNFSLNTLCMYMYVYFYNVYGYIYIYIYIYIYTIYTIYIYILYMHICYILYVYICICIYVYIFYFRNLELSFNNAYWYLVKTASLHKEFHVDWRLFLIKYRRKVCFMNFEIFNSHILELVNL